MKKFIICVLLCLTSFSAFATITREDLESFYIKPDGCIIIENDYDVFHGYRIYGKESIHSIFIGHDNKDNAYCWFYVGGKSEKSGIKVSASKSYYDKEKNILHLYRII